MSFEYPGKYIEYDSWDQYLIDHVPSLAKLHSAGKYDAYETWKILNNLTHDDFVRDYIGAGDGPGIFYAPYMPFIQRLVSNSKSQELSAIQPMNALTGKIFNFKKD